MPLWSRVSRVTSNPKLEVIILAALAYVPLLLTAPGVVGADTKPYLYLDPSKLLSGAPYLWLEDVGLGTVPHQNIGYLWPMGPFFWLSETLGLPDWVGQRLWLATIMFAAAMGVRSMLRAIGWNNGGVFIASLAYMLSPYPLSYVARISVLTLPWAGLGWLISFAARSLRVGGWRYPAGFALVAMTIGGTNATSLLLIGIGPVLWLLHAWYSTSADDGPHNITFPAVVATALRIGALTALTALWWVVGLVMQGTYGPSVLRYTETYEAIADSSTATEAFRGLGYWFFYGNDSLGQWIEPSIAYTSRTPLLILSFGLPILALAAAAMTRWRHRSFFVLLIVVGGFMAVGGHPYESSSFLGNWFTEFTRSDTGLALRSTPRATPLLVLGTSVLLGAGVSALSRWRPPVEGPLRAVLTVLIIANLPPLWTGQFIAEHLQRPEEIPDYWVDAIDHLDAAGNDTRILEVPGADFASYRWGNTVEPITPGLTDRPYIARELVPFGSEPAASLVIELDRRFQEGEYSPEALAPVARLMGVGDVVLRADLKYERFRTPRPDETWAQLLETPGLDEPILFGPQAPNVAGPEQTLIDEIELGADLLRQAAAESPSPVAVFGVSDPLPIVRVRPADSPIIVAGDAQGLVDAGAAGLIDTDRLLLFSATFADRQDELAAMLNNNAGADLPLLIVTDSNRRQARHWGTIRENTGYIERAEEEPADDPGDYRLDVFPEETSAHQTVAVHEGATVTASNYGNPVTYTVDNRATLGVDGDKATAWRVGAFDDVRGESLQIELDRPVADVASIQVVQPLNGNRNRFITELRVHTDDTFVDVALDASSRRRTGQEISFTQPHSFRTLRLEILATNAGPRDNYVGLSGVGIAEVEIPGVDVAEVIRVPTDLLAASSDLGQQPLALVLSRLRSDAREPVRSDGEEMMRRRVELPESIGVALSGQARLSSYASDQRVAQLLSPDDLVARTSASGSLAGALNAKPRAAFDHDQSTIFTTPFGPQPDHWLEYQAAAETTIDSLDLDVVVDDRHSVPTVIDVIIDGTLHETVSLPTVDGLLERNQSVSFSVPIAEAQGTTFRLVFRGVNERITKEWYSRSQVALPLGISEWRIGDATPAQQVDGALQFDTGCRDDLLSIAGRPAPVRVTGTRSDALARRPLDITGCEPSTALPAGDVDIMTARGRSTGIDIDQLVLTTHATDQLGTAAAAPSVKVLDDGRVHTEVEIDSATSPYWFVLGQSVNDGWKATSPQLGDLGPPTLVDGYANGWLIDPSAYPQLDGPVNLRVEWTPQQTVAKGLWATVFGALLCLALFITGRRQTDLSLSGGPVSNRPLPDDPRLATKRQDPSSAPAWQLLVGALGIGVFALLNLPQWRAASIVFPVLLVASLKRETARRSLPAAAALLLVLSGAYTTIQQFRHRFPTGFGWPEFFGDVHVLSVAALLMLATEVVRIRLDSVEHPAPDDHTPHDTDHHDSRRLPH